MIETINTISFQELAIKELASYFTFTACECKSCADILEMHALGDMIGVVIPPGV